MIDALRHTLELEAAAITAAADRVAEAFYHAAVMLTETDTIVFTGMGKSGFVAQKAASTFRSLGMRAFYIHPSEASHGDLGGIGSKTVAVILSHSGETSELADLIHHCQTNLVPTIAITGRPDSTLAEAVTTPLVYGDVKEACPNGLAPTTSTAVSMALCDALAVAMARFHKRTPSDFERFHPGGKLGARLKPVVVVMQAVPIVRPTDDLLVAAAAMTGTVAGVALVVGKHGAMGVLTDGDLRRAITAGFTTAQDAMSKDPITVDEGDKVETALAVMQRERVTKVFVEDVLGAIIGVVNLHDC